jgi:hypothetical protein
LQELRQMEHFQQPPTGRRGTVFSLDSSETAQLKSELMLLQKKFDRLEQKEKRMQACFPLIAREKCLRNYFCRVQ